MGILTVLPVMCGVWNAAAPARGAAVADFG
jgi:hypothetical protein